MVFAPVLFRFQASRVNKHIIGTADVTLAPNERDSVPYTYRTARSYASEIAPDWQAN